MPKVELMHVRYLSLDMASSLKRALGNYFNLIKPFRNHLNGLITRSGENGDLPCSPQRPRVENQPCNMGANVPVSLK